MSIWEVTLRIESGSGYGYQSTTTNLRINAVQVEELHYPDNAIVADSIRIDFDPDTEVQLVEKIGQLDS